MIELLALGPRARVGRDCRRRWKKRWRWGPETRPRSAISSIARGLEKPAVAEIEIGALVRYDRPEPVMTGYDQLLRKVQV
jgi:hypothetical protein